MNSFETLLDHIRNNDTLRQQYLSICRQVLNTVVFDITTAVNDGGGHLNAHKDGTGDEVVNGALRMQLQLQLPAPLTFDLFTTHLDTWVGVRPLDSERFELTMPELPQGIVVRSSQEAMQVFFQQLALADDRHLQAFVGTEQLITK